MSSPRRAFDRKVALGAVGLMVTAAVAFGCGKSTTQNVTETPAVSQTAVASAAPSTTATAYTPPRTACNYLYNVVGATAEEIYKQHGVGRACDSGPPIILQVSGRVPSGTPAPPDRCRPGSRPLTRARDTWCASGPPMPPVRTAGWSRTTWT